MRVLVIGAGIAGLRPARKGETAGSKRARPRRCVQLLAVHRFDSSNAGRVARMPRDIGSLLRARAHELHDLRSPDNVRPWRDVVRGDT
jgi:hypothetical protein